MSEQHNDDLARFADRLERLLDSADETRADLKSLKTEVRSAGYDPAALTKVVALRRDERRRAREEERLQQVALYAQRLGLQLEFGL